MPQTVRRPEGPDGILPTIMKRPAPDDPGENLSSTGYNDTSLNGHANPEAWTPYQSEAVNVGPIHPNHAEPTLCDVELVGQIWNGQDVVLNEYRSKRLFTTAQRKAIFARDKGCQAPGCMIQATYCQCHHCKEWSTGGQTNEDNAITLCAHHHADVHNGKWTIRKVDGVTYFSQPNGSTRTNHCYATYTGTFSKISDGLCSGTGRHVEGFIFCAISKPIWCIDATGPRWYAHF